ncbi:predicted protein [Sclerotinia sclerotiorum 1980 UF-70]|uniref:Uncharacterized protein n=1 Tax=Sclerotinia sclerotiorum (strain ATCC 18683 / 1980 / Ss-1) TaxID=665079 RepID=A7EJA0_SCLS1|nr:predicted protein [Sclerotinia sclerotiorum 1980 UF-70]EDO02916.1 predicted protein [Sclerotinia sclerotiorum 1980 UF-70]
MKVTNLDGRLNDFRMTKRICCRIYQDGFHISRKTIVLTVSDDTIKVVIGVVLAGLSVL